ncbi:MAG: hypothetical protein IJO71_11450 [Microbacterium sp.]|uniref:hypothetical protein n=1 Tax=Microbacterium sp. TaxID=51671 RepID=UPI0025FD2C07|nr:hypothetical protein [Microbacterium sp.]MBQ9917799.1 hypothetical protein [Microbacterium sp.]
MTEPLRIALLDENGRIDERALPPLVASGGPQEVQFPFAGTLVVATGRFYWLTPPAEIRLVRLAITLGTLGTGGGTVTAALVVNGSALASINVAAGTRVATGGSFTPDLVPANQLVSVDITQVPSVGATRPGDAVVQVMWEYA